MIYENEVDEGVRKAASMKEVLTSTITFILMKWPQSTPEAEMLELYRSRNYLAVINLCLMLSDQVVILAVLRSAALTHFHFSYPGINCMKPITMSYAYWRGVDDDIERLVKQWDKW